MFSLAEASALAREDDVAAVLVALDRYLEGESGPGRFRGLRNVADPAAAVAAHAGLAGLGLPGVFLPERTGGLGLAPGIAALAGERMGRSLAVEPFVENVVLPAALALALGHEGQQQAIAGGEALCLAWQEGAFSRPDEQPVATVFDGRTLKGTKRYVMGARAARRLVVLALQDGKPVLVAVRADAPGVGMQHKVLADGTFWSEVALDTPAAGLEVLARGAPALEGLAQAIDLGNIALAGVLYGLQSRILEMTLEYLGTRVQFDRPIGSFQVLQHRAVEAYTQAQITRFLVGEVADATTAGAPALQRERLASRAKCRAAEAGLRIGREGIQMHGGIGFSDEYDLGLYVKRILVLTAWLGNADWHRRHLFRIDPRGEAEAA